MKKKIKLLIITHTFPTKYNPVAAIFLLNQLNALKKYCEIKVIFPYLYSPKIKFLNPFYKYSKIPKYEKVKGIKVYHPKYLMFPRMLFIRKFLNVFLVIESFFSYIASKKTAEDLVRKWDPDIIHMHGALSEGLLGVKLKREYNKPLLVTTYGEDVSLFSKKFFSNYLIKFTLKNSDTIICQSKSQEKEMDKIGIVNKRFFMIPMGANLEKFSPKDKNKTRKNLNLPINKKIVLFVGHLVTRKGVEYLIKSIKIISKKDKNILGCIIGKGILENIPGKMTLVNKENQRRTLEVAHENIYKLEIEHFANCIENDREPLISGKEGMANMQVAFAAYRSSQESRAVTLGHEA